MSQAVRLAGPFGSEAAHPTFSLPFKGGSWKEQCLGSRTAKNNKYGVGAQPGPPTSYIRDRCVSVGNRILDLLHCRRTLTEKSHTNGISNCYSDLGLYYYDKKKHFDINVIIHRNLEHERMCNKETAENHTSCCSNCHPWHVYKAQEFAWPFRVHTESVTKYGTPDQISFSEKLNFTEV